MRSDYMTRIDWEAYSVRIAARPLINDRVRMIVALHCISDSEVLLTPSACIVYPRGDVRRGQWWR